MFDYTMPQFKISNKIRLIELFAGYGSQAMALDIIGADCEIIGNIHEKEI